MKYNYADWESNICRPLDFNKKNDGKYLKKWEKKLYVSRFTYEWKKKNYHRIRTSKEMATNNDDYPWISSFLCE